LSDTLVPERTTPPPRPVRPVDLAVQLIGMRQPGDRDAVDMRDDMNRWAFSMGVDIAGLPADVRTLIFAGWVARGEHDRIHANLAGQLAADLLRHSA
jgi:hypothetical protein